MRTATIAGALTALALVPTAVFAQQEGRNLAAPCAICHGTEGRAVTPAVASLAGMSKEHIAAQMRAFRDGKRPATVMHQIAKGYTDAQIDSMAAWYAMQKQ